MTQPSEESPTPGLVSGTQVKGRSVDLLLLRVGIAKEQGEAGLCVRGDI